MDKKIVEFTDLKAWKEAHTFVLLVYRVTKKFPREEVFSLTDQVRRAVTSVTSNIAEGFGRHSFKEKIRFYYIAQGSLSEAKNHLFVARDLAYISTKEFDTLFQQANTAHKLLQGLITKSKTYLRSSL